MKSKIFCCYSLELRKYLTSKNIRYEAVGLNPDTHRMFWAYIKDSKLNCELQNWKNVKK
jgi:hypothetical protein